MTVCQMEECIKKAKPREEKWKTTTTVQTMPAVAPATTGKNSNPHDSFRICRIFLLIKTAKSI